MDPSGALYEITIGPVDKDKNELIYFVYFQDGRILLRIENSASGTPLYQVAARPPEAFLTYIDSCYIPVPLLRSRFFVQPA